MQANTIRDDLADDGETIDLAAIFIMLWKRRWWIVASVVSCTALSAIYAFATPPVYRASVLMVSADNSAGSSLEGALSQLGGLASLAGIQAGSASIAKQESLAVLRSRELTEAFIHDKNLTPLLFPRKWDEKNLRWKTGERPPTPAEAYKYFGEKVRSITEDKKTSLITLQIDWTDRLQAAAWANELVERLNAEMQMRAIASAEASLGYLEKELQATTTVATREAINRLIEVQIKQRMLANVTREYAFRVVDKAMAPDASDPIRPRKMFALAGGVFGGGVLGIVAVLVTSMMPAGIGSRLQGEGIASQS